MTETIVVLTEEPLNESDLQNLGWLAGEQTVAEQTIFRVLIPEDTKRNLLLDFLERLSMLEVGTAFRELAQVSALVAYVGAHAADRAVVITRPHAISDTFHTDWANRAQEKLGIPVLHLYSGSGYIGDS